MSLEPDYIRKILKYTPDELSDDDIQFYIERYTELVKYDSGLTESQLNDPKNEFILHETIIHGIGCDLLADMPNERYIKRQKIGNTEEEYSDIGYKKIADSCDKYKANLNKLSNLEKPTHNVAPFRRRWLHTLRR